MWENFERPSVPLTLLVTTVVIYAALRRSGDRRKRQTSPAPRPAPRLIGGIGKRMQEVMSSMPILHAVPETPMNLPGLLQLIIFALHSQWQEQRFEREFVAKREEVEVDLPGESVTCGAETVGIQWILGRRGEAQKELPAHAPLVVVLPGLNCYAANLPGTSIYHRFLAEDWRIAVFEKRGVGPPGVKSLTQPAFHTFGHPSDLHAVMLRVQEEYPDAPIHIVGNSSGNGLAGSYTTLFGPQIRNLRSCLLLIGGEDYNLAFAPPKANWVTKLVYDVVLLASCKERFLRRNAEVLKRHSEAGYAAAMATTKLQEFYEIAMRHFSGYSDRHEAERRINNFSGHNRALAEVCVPFMVVYTEDDPVAPGGPRPAWLDVVADCEKAAVALYPSGSHLGCYEGWSGARWVDQLAVEWLKAHMQESEPLERLDGLHVGA